MSISSLSVEERVRALPIGAVFVVRWLNHSGRPAKAVWRRHSDYEIELLVDENGAVDRPYLDDIADNWVPDAVIQPLTDNESARVLALAALGRGDLI